MTTPQMKGSGMRGSGMTHIVLSREYNADELIGLLAAMQRTIFEISGSHAAILQTPPGPHDTDTHVVAEIMYQPKASMDD